MIFDIDKIIEGDLDFKVTETKSHFKIDQPDCSLGQDVTIEGTLKKVGEAFYLSGRLSTEVKTICSRCLEDVTFPVRAEVLAKYLPESKLEEMEEESEIHGNDLDTEFYSENKIDITQAVHDQILLEIPPVTLCRENCRGLCPKCGINLNNEACGCAREESIDPRLASLLALKNKLK